jgi:hypothetical protein
MWRETVIRRVSILAIAAAIWLCAPAHAFVLTGATTPDPAQVDFDSCPANPGYSCTVSALNLTYLPTGPNADFLAAWSTVLPGEWNPAGWTLDWSSDPIDATLNASTYRAVGHESGATDSGAELRIQWTPTSEQTDLRWIQALHTNRPRAGMPYYLDIATYTASKPPVYMYQYTDQHFYDKPARICEAGQSIFWEASLYLARVDQTNKIATIFDGVHWGFEIDSVAVPEPSSLVVMIAGPICLALRRGRTANR